MDLNYDGYDDPLVSPTQYHSNQAARVGSRIACAFCLTPMKKKSYQHQFCRSRGSSNCKDLYWNRADPERLERARRFG